jgi:phosphohistidine phosphatase
MGAYMAQHGLVPDQVICSAARRAVETWNLASEALGRTIPTDIREDFYHASPSTLLAAIQTLNPDVESVLLVGHNPTMEDLALALAGTGDERSLREMALKYPTGALAVLDFEASVWEEVKVGAGHLREFVRPKSLR